MATVRIAVQSAAANSNLAPWVGSVKLMIGSKVVTLQKRLLDGVKSHFNVRASGPSKPGTFPYRLSGKAVKSIHVVDYSKNNFIGFKIGTTKDNAGFRIPRLTRGFTITPTGKRILAIPVSYEARLHSSKSDGAANWARAFPRKLTYVMWRRLYVGKNKKRGPKGSSVSPGFLGELLSSNVNKPNVASGRRQRSAFFGELQARSLKGRGGDVRTGKYVTLPNGKQYKVHYILSRRPAPVPPRLGLADAIKIELGQIGKVW